MFNYTHSEIVQSNLLSEGIQFSIHVHRAVSVLKGKIQSVCNNAHSEVDQNNLLAEGTKFSIHVHRAVDIL